MKLDKRFLIAGEIIERLEKNGYQAYFVGGCVRDFLLNRAIQDIDIATSALPQTVISLFKKVIPVGLEHGTVIVRHKSQSFEVTTFRIDGVYSDYRRPDHVEFIDHIELDLKRRDFTINALAMSRQGQMIDLFNGQDDLKGHLIRTVGNGEKRFKEDALRIIRALRFSSQLGFAIEKETLAAMEKVKAALDEIAVERMTSEMTKLVAGAHIQKGMNYLLEINISNHLPIFSEHPNLLSKLAHHLRPMQSFSEFMALLHYVKPEISISEWSNGWKCSNKTKHLAANLVGALHYFATNGLNHWLVYKLHSVGYHSFLNLVDMLSPNQRINRDTFFRFVSTLPIQSKKDLAINGTTLVQMFPHYQKGPWVSQMLNQLEKKVVMNELTNNHHTLKEWIKCNPPEIS